MPLGLEEEGFILQCYATVIDDLGGSGTYFIQEVQVGIPVNPFKPNGILHSYQLDQSISL